MNIFIFRILTLGRLTRIICCQLKQKYFYLTRMLTALQESSRQQTAVPLSSRVKVLSSVTVPQLVTVVILQLVHMTSA